MAGDVWTYVEHRDGKVKRIAYELLGAGRRVADRTGGTLSAVLVGAGMAGMAAELAEHDADRVLVVDREDLSQYTTDGYCSALAEIAGEQGPDVILLGCTAQGRDLAPPLAQRLDCGLVADCTDLAFESGRLTFTRPLYAGKALARVASSGAGPLVATLRPNVFPAASAGNGTQAQDGAQARAGVPVHDGARAEIVECVVRAPAIRQVVRETAPLANGRPELTEADVIVSGGRGMKGPEHFRLLEELADVLGGAVGASRAAVDAGWIEHVYQVGQTGKTVSPKLYIACGISGAVQHMAGMGSAKCLVAINRDPEAAIFKVADFGIVGDLFEVVPLLRAEIEKILA